MSINWLKSSTFRWVYLGHFRKNVYFLHIQTNSMNIDCHQLKIPQNYAVKFVVIYSDYIYTCIQLKKIENPHCHIFIFFFYIVDMFFRILDRKTICWIHPIFFFERKKCILVLIISFSYHMENQRGMVNSYLGP